MSFSALVPQRYSHLAPENQAIRGGEGLRGDPETLRSPLLCTLIFQHFHQSGKHLIKESLQTDFELHIASPGVCVSLRLVAALRTVLP